MAEFPRQIRQVGGGMESHRSPYGPRRLLPAEAELCNALGIKESEYWQFIDLIQLHKPTRLSEYDLIPDIVNEPTTIGYATWTAFFVNVAVGVALSYVAYLLTPKPKQPEIGTNLRTEDKYGSRAFAPQQGFNSVQDLATLGSIIPLIFTKQEEVDGYTSGGVRVNAQLLWSQLISLGRSQQLKALALFSHGELDGEPDFAGYAIGDLLIENYNKAKVALYFRKGAVTNNNRITTGDKYNEGTLPESTFSDIDGNTDPFSVEFPVKFSSEEPSKRAFSGTTNPTTQSIFGLYSPMPNGHRYKLPYEFFFALLDMEEDTKLDTFKKDRKIKASWPTRAGIIKANNVTGRNKGLTVPVGAEVKYQIFSSGTQKEQENIPDYDPWKVEDVKSSVSTIRETADNNLALGESYMAGTALLRLTRISSNPNSPGKTWEVGITKEYYFKVVESGQLDTIDMPQHLANPQWIGEKQCSKSGCILINQDTSTNRNLGTPWDTYALQRVAIGTISNTRDCHLTEVGIKSKVYKNINFQNVNSQPDEATVNRYHYDNATISLGQIQKSITRFSFFKLQVREAGKDSSWSDLTNTSNSHSGLFCIIGNTQQEQYNYISIRHPQKGQYEYRFLPVPGVHVARTCLDTNNENNCKDVNVLNASYSEDNDAVQQFTSNGFVVRFVGRDDLTMTANKVSNSEWVANLADSLELGATTGPVSSLSRTDTAGPGQTLIWPSEWAWRDSNRFGSEHPITLTYIPAKYYYPTSNWVGKKLWLVVKANFQGNTAWIFFLGSVHLGGTQGPQSMGVVYTENPADAILEYGGYRYYPYAQVRTTHPEDPTIPQIQWSVMRLDYTQQDAANDFTGTVSTTTTGGGSGLTVYLETASIPTNHVARWRIVNRGNGYKDGDTINIPARSEGIVPFPGVSLQVTVERQNTDDGTTVINNLNPYDKISDYPQYYDNDVLSSQSGPEHEISYVNQVIEPVDNYGVAKYKDLAFAGIRINSSKEWTSFSQLSAYFTKGIKVERLIDGGTGATNLFPEIAYALLTDKKTGAGELIGSSSVDKQSMEAAAKFCRANGFKWDGMISSSLNLREFIFEMAGYAFLDFTIIGGQFSLEPSVPYKGTATNPGEIDYDAKPDIRALFSDGNISDLKVSFLSPEERQLFRAAVMYRKESKNGFPETKTCFVRLADSSSDKAPIEKFDLSSFCTSKTHAEKFAKYAIKTRQLVDHGLSFKTSPQNCVGLRPGQYFRLVSEATHTSRFNNGAITDTGEIISRDPITTSQPIYYWKPGTTQVLEGQLNPTSVAGQFKGSLFTIRNSTTESRVYKVESISYSEEGLIEIGASFVPLTSSGSLAVLEWAGLNDHFIYTDS
tara:strand:- start:734 stop:4801 length:4068 start_codon:yes stop_codon:yes gene_type:complete